MIVSIHQPNLFPWLGFFDKMARADVFVLLDNVPFTKGGYQNRVRIKGPSGPLWLTVPVITKGRLGQSTMDVEINNTVEWKRTHLGSLKTDYSSAPGFHKLMAHLLEIYSLEVAKLVDFAIPGILLLKEMLGINVPIVRASQLGVSGSGSQLLCDIVKQLGGTIYLSGQSGRNYLDILAFERANISVEYHLFEPFQYPQRFGAFIPGLSALDYLANDPDAKLWHDARRKEISSGRE